MVGSGPEYPRNSATALPLVVPGNVRRPDHVPNRPDDSVNRERVGTDDHEDDRFAAITLEGGEVIIYDTHQASAWLQSTSAVELTAVV